jgi:hypothetical protein
MFFKSPCNIAYNCDGQLHCLWSYIIFTEFLVSKYKQSNVIKTGCRRLKKLIMKKNISPVKSNPIIKSIDKKNSTVFLILIETNELSKESLMNTY